MPAPQRQLIPLVDRRETPSERIRNALQILRAPDESYSDGRVVYSADAISDVRRLLGLAVRQLEEPSPADVVAAWQQMYRSTPDLAEVVDRHIDEKIEAVRSRVDQLESSLAEIRSALGRSAA